MIFYCKDIPKNCEIALHGDTHYGDILCYKKGVVRFRNWLLEKPESRFFYHMGDAIEGIMVTDKRFDVRTNKEPVPMDQANHVIAFYKSVGKQCILWHKGNHEDTLKRFGNLASYMASGIGAKYGTWSGITQFTVKGKQVFKVYTSHGFRGTIKSNAKDPEQQQANMAAAMKRRLSKKFGDCLVMAVGHTHLLMVVPPVQRLFLTSDSEQIHHGYLGAAEGTERYIDPHSRWYVNTGSFMKMYEIGYDGYAERAGYDPVELGYAVMQVRDGRLVNIEKVVI